MRTLRIFLCACLFFPVSTFAQEVEGTPTEGEVLKAQASVLSSTASSLSAAPGMQQAVAAANKLSATAAACASKKTLTDNACLETMNPAIKTFTDEYGAVMQMGFMIGGTMADQCSAIGKTLKAASMALTAYQAACSGSMAICSSSCSSIPAQVAALNTAVNASGAACAAAHPPTNICPYVEGLEQLMTIAYKVKSAGATVAQGCAGYSKNLGSALVGVLSAIASAKQAKNCEDEFKGDGTAIGEACVDPKNLGYNSPNCKCARNELTAAECQRINVSNPALGSGSGVRVGEAGSLTDSGTAVDLTAGGTAAESKIKDNGGAPSLPGAPAGGGGGGLGGGGGGSGVAAQDGSGYSRKLNANILGGFGGGGGGGGMGGAGPGYGEVDKKLQEHGPGGKLDPKRSLASQMAKEITAQGGRSNWEKVRDRYRDNKRTLLMNK